MKTITRKWRKWLAIPLVIVLALSIALPLQLSQEPELVLASGVDATNVTLTGQDTTDDFTYVRFDIGWDYSWRDAENWDAIWVFVKYKLSGGDWAHATLSTTSADHSITVDNGVAGTITVTSDGKGVLAHRTDPGTGNINWDGIELKWQYGTDGLVDADLVTVKVFATEMVYIPQGAFYVGDYDNTLQNTFFRADGSYLQNETLGPYQVTSEAEITVDGNIDGALYYDNDIADPGDQLGPIPADFPKGYNDFYMMKYELSQRQYAEFLNTLTAIQQTERFIGSTGTDRQYIKKVGNVYGSDASGNDILNESDDGEWVAANFMSWADITAYADWAGLRPYTELEFEKAARGTAAVVNDEYAWGTATAVQATGYSAEKTAAEVATATGNPNVSYNSATTGPLRNGAYTDADDTREEAGASYYGVMELSGNLWEKLVTVGHPTGRLFDGTHGDGALDATGDADVSLWPGINAEGSGSRGAAWTTITASISQLRIANRKYAAVVSPTNKENYGARLVRTAP